MSKTKAYMLIVTVLEKPDSSYSCDCERGQKAETHFTFLTMGQPPVVLAESYLCKDCADQVRKPSEKR